VSAETILIADDDGAIRTVISEALTRIGYDVRAAGNAATLWRWVEEGDGDLVVTDVIMPDENGLDLLPRIQRIRPDLKIIVMSAESTIMTALRAAERGAYEYLPKPFDLNELVTVVRRALAEPKPGATPTPDGAAADEQLPLIGRSPAMQDAQR
jgi:two-component system nitrogen regulation response regulator GlnG